jgi:hypothetical protein
MKQIMRLILMAIGLSGAIYLQSCKEKEACQNPRDPECENYNPCIDAKPVSAAFHMYEAHNLLWMPELWVNYDTDTSITNQVRFKALETNSLSYTWYIGTEVEPRTGSSVVIDFDNNRTPKRIRLIVKKDPNRSCFPNDDGVDTLDRMLYFIDRFDSLNAPMIGSFKGVSTKNPTEQITVQIGYYFLPIGYWYTTITGFSDCTAYVTSLDWGFRRFIAWKMTQRAPLPNGEISKSCGLFEVIGRMPDNSDSIYVQYKESSEGTLYYFTGVKIR